MEKTIGLAVIAKNEAHRIAKCLNSAKPYMDDMVVVDTGSTDNTIEVAEQCGARVFKSEFFDKDTPRNKFEFAKARNESFAQLTTDYIMWLDCDDFLPPTSGEIIRQRIDEGCNEDVILCPYHYAFYNGQVAASFPRERIVKNGNKFVEPIHEYIPLQGTIMQWNDVYVEHHREHVDSQKLYERNISILLEHLAHRPNDARLLYYSAKEHYDYGSFDECLPLLLRHIQVEIDPEMKSCSFVRMSECYKRLGRDGERIMSLNDAIKVCPYRIDPYYLLADYHSNHNPSVAEYWLKKATKLKFQSLQPDNPQLYGLESFRRLGELYEKTGQPEKAKQYRRGVLQKDLTNVSLHIGCGAKSYKDQGYRDCDVVDLPHVDHVFSMESVPFPDNSVQRILSEHALEHVSRDKAAQALKDWNRVLKPGGELILRIPDMEECCRQYVKAVENNDTTLEFWYHQTIHGAQTPENGVTAEWQFHLTGWNMKSLKRDLEHIGFSIDYMEKYNAYDTPALSVRALKLRRPWSVHWHVDPYSNWGPHRIRLFNVERAMRVFGYNSKISFEKSDVAVISHPSFIETYERARKQAKYVIFDLHEDMTQIRPQIREILSKVDAVVSCSHKMDEIAAKYCDKHFVIEDTIETPETLQCAYEQRSKPCIVWYGYKGNRYKLEEIRNVIENAGYEIVVIHEPGSNPGETQPDVVWNDQKWMYDLISCDAAIITTDDALHPAKSHIRVVQAMALGLPVIAYPRDAFSRVISSGQNGYMVHNDDELSHALQELKNTDKRREIGQAGCAAVQKFRFEHTAHKWAAVIDTLQNWDEKPKVTIELIDDPIEPVDIVIPSYKNLPYLKHTINSIRSNTEAGTYRIIVADGDSGEEMVEWLKEQTHDVTSVIGGRMTFAEATNAGLLLSKGDVCFLNNDVIVRPGWLSSMKKKLYSQTDIGAVGPFSNCDVGFRHQEIAQTGNVIWDVNRKLEEFSEQDLESLYNLPISNKPQNDEFVDWLPFYCTLVKKEVINKIQLLDTGFRNGGEDFDYSRKIAELGYKMLIDRNSEVWHFGGKTRKVLSGELGEIYKQEDNANWERQKRIWNAKRVVIYCGMGWEPWSPDSINKGGIGGSETAAVLVAKEFKKLGYIVTVLAEAEGIYNGVIYRHHSKLNEVVEKGADIFISSRRMDVINDYIRSKCRKILVWVHDIFLSQEKRPQGWRWDLVDHFLTLSEWHRDFLAHHHEIDPAKIVQTRNGIDIARFEGENPRIPGRMVYSSSLDRGLLTLAQYMPRIQERVPEAHLHVCYGLDSWERAANQRKIPQELEQIRATKSVLEAAPWITYHGRVGQQELADLYKTAKLWAYPTWFTETYCCTAIEAMAAGCPAVTSNLAGLQTTVGKYGDLLDGFPVGNGHLGTEEYQAQFIDKVCELLTNDNLWTERSLTGMEYARSLTWSGVAEQWQYLCEST